MIVQHKKADNLFGIATKIKSGICVKWEEGYYCSFTSYYAEGYEIEENIEFICKPIKKCKMCYRKLKCITE